MTRAGGGAPSPDGELLQPEKTGIERTAGRMNTPVNRKTPSGNLCFIPNLSPPVGWRRPRENNVPIRRMLRRSGGGRGPVLDWSEGRIVGDGLSGGKRNGETVDSKTQLCKYRQRERSYRLKASVRAAIACLLYTSITGGNYIRRLLPARVESPSFSPIAGHTLSCSCCARASAAW